MVQTKRGSDGNPVVPDIKVISGQQFLDLPKRVKPLPRDANPLGSQHTLYQLEEHIRHKCIRCNKIGITADVVAFEDRTRTMQCVRCFERLVRPRKFQAARVHPFPTMVAWLHYDPSKAVKASKDDPMNKPTEAFLPSGSRVAQSQVAFSDISEVPQIPLNSQSSIVGGGKTDASVAADTTPSAGPATTHPCVRMWGSCAHGTACRLQNAPRMLCIPYLLGVCPQSDADCPYQHESFEGLPRPLDNVASIPHKNTPQYEQWLAQRRAAAHPVLWQLWNNGDVPVPDVQNGVVVAAEQQQQPEDVRALQAALNMLD